MKKPKLPLNENKRLQALQEYNILDSKEEQTFDDLTQLAAKICGTPIALISLVDQDRQWFKSCFGLNAKETPRDVSFCGHAIQESNLFVVEDSTKDERFKDNPLVTGYPHVRFYAGAPLITPTGFHVGTICVIDHTPRKLNLDQRAALEVLSRQVIGQLELRKKQRELVMNQQKMVAIQRSHCVIEFDLQGNILSANKNFLKLSGYSLQEILGKHHSMFVTKADAISLEYQQFWAALKEGKFQSGDFKRLDKLGKEMWTRGCYCPVLDFNGNTHRILTFSYDVTEIKTASEKIKRAEEELTDLITNSNIGLHWLDSNGIILWANKAELDLLGYTALEYIGQPIENFHADKNIAQELLNRSLAQEQLKNYEVQLVAKDGSVKEVNIHSSHYVVDGKLIYTRCFSSDITKEKQQTRDKIEKTKELDQFFEMAIDLLCIAGTDGYFKKINSSFERVLGYSTEELLSTPFASFIHPDDLAPTANVVAQLSQGQTIVNFQNRYKTKHGDYIHINWTATPRANGSIYAIGRDMTDAIKAKILEEDRDRAILSDQAKSDFLYTMSHEIRTPLNGIIGMTNLLAETQLNSEQKEYAETVRQSGHILMAIINDVLDFSKIEAGKMDLEESEFDFSSYLKELMKPFQYIVEKKQIKFKLELTKFDYCVKGDSGKIGQIINNLVSNAIKFTKTGEVTVKSDCKMSGDRAELTLIVQDTGIGIKEEAQAKMFHAFNQAEKSTSRNFGGTGLGLSISKRLAELMGGTISFVSEFGKGTSFTVQIPLKKGTKLTSEIEDSSKSIQNDILEERLSGRILVAEDNSTNQMVIGRMLEKLGCKFQIVANGNEVLDALRDSKFDLILMDCQMPEMDGYTASKTIRNSRTLDSTIPIVALTANAVKGDQQKCEDYGMNEYLSKPIDKKALLSTLKRYLKETNNTVNEQKNTWIDKTVLMQFEDLQLEGEPDILIQLIDAYLSEAPIQLSKIQQHAKTRNLQNVAREAHTLKSSSLSLGSHSLGKICQQLESFAKINNVADLDTLVSSLTEAFAGSCTELSAIRDERSQSNNKKAA